MDFGNDESDEEALLLKKEERSEPLEDWDLFLELPPDKDADLEENRTVYTFVLRILKLITYAVLFSVVLGAAIVSKLVTVLMTSQLRNETEPVPYCHKTYRGSSVEFLASNSVEERISWVWALFFCFLVPETLTFLRGLRILIFKGHVKPNLTQFLLPFIFETLHTIGLALLVYLVLPKMDSGKAVMLTNAMCIVPGILGMLSRGYEDKNWVFGNVIDIVAILFQLSSLFVWPLFVPQYRRDNPWMIPLSLVLISFGWWENFVEVTSPFRFLQKLGNIKRELRKTRYFTYCILSVWKIGVFLAMLVVATRLNEGSWSISFDILRKGFQSHNVTVTEKRPSVRNDTSLEEFYLHSGTEVISNVKTAVLYTMAVQMVSSYICYVMGKVACRILIQTFSYSLPVLLSVPATLTVLIAMCSIRNENVCFWESLFPGYLWWMCPSGQSFWKNYFIQEHTWAWLLWLISQTWITIHIWSPKSLRLAHTEAIFATPMYNAFMVDQSLALNRRRDEGNLQVSPDEEEDDDKDLKKINEENCDDDEESRLVSWQTTQSTVRPEDYIPKIYACATMWHETENEMIKMLKSVFRMDADQSARRLARKMFGIEDPGYYEFETHIFFDDAFQNVKPENSIKTKSKKLRRLLNPHARNFIAQMEEAASEVHRAPVKLRTPKKIPTPYGGRLEWKLPGRTNLICHLKDKDKIRNKKRWSQVMYLYYLLGYKLMGRTDLPPERKEVIADNTFLLALDGDIDFQPKSVELLVDLMKKNRNLGAACGRIHPVGKGAMVWYQKFEYAVGHWFQKATEHVFGCVLCSPGCFSLFRAKTLMDYDVAKKYTTVATEPLHHIQYDQGEDRWLCTLILQRGWRVEYSAASDAYTNAPDTFREFFNQRRRWVPSTMANIMDLLLNGRKTVKQNPDISYPYIMYQMFLMVGSILGPGTIFLMLVGAFSVAFKIEMWSSFLYNFIPVFLFILACYFLKPDIQLTFAEVLTTIYALAMVAVVVAIILQVADDGLFAPSTLFLVVVAGSFIIAGIVHPLEFSCLLHGFLYYISIPSMYLLLIVYSLFNLNIVSWGTRESPSASDRTAQEQGADKAKPRLEKKRKSFLGSILPKLGFGGREEKEDDSTLDVSCSSLFNLSCCVCAKSEDQKEKSDTIILLSEMSRKLEHIEKFVDRQENSSGRKLVTIEEDESSMGSQVTSNESESVASTPDSPNMEKSRENKKRNYPTKSHYWMKDGEISNFQADSLTLTEETFWEKVIGKYLRPLDHNEEKQKAVAKGLKALRNKVAFTFVMCNAVFVVLIFLLQLDKETIHINWPFDAKTNVTYKARTAEIEVSFEYLELEPIGLAFIGVFGLVLGTQFIGMMIHRLSTFLHIMALTELNFGGQENKTRTVGDNEIKKEIGLIKRLQSERDADMKKSEGRKSRLPINPGSRHTVIDLEKNRVKSEQYVYDLARNVNTNFAEMGNEKRRQSSKIFHSERRRETFEMLKERRDTVLQSRRNSTLERRRNVSADNYSLLNDSVRVNRPIPSISITLSPPSPPHPPLFLPQLQQRFRRNLNSRRWQPQGSARNVVRDQFEMKERT